MPIITNVARIASGMDTAMMNVFRNDRRKISTMIIARIAPVTAAVCTAPSASRMNED